MQKQRQIPEPEGLGVPRCRHDPSRSIALQGHEGVTEGSHEYLTYGSVFQTLAAHFGLYPVLDYEWQRE